MARKNDGFYTVLILLGFFVFIIAKIVEFIAQNMTIILLILSIVVSVIFVYYIFKKWNKQKIENSENSIIDIEQKDVDELSPVSLIETCITKIKDIEIEEKVIKDDVDFNIKNRSANDEQKFSDSIICKKVEEEIINYKISKYQNQHDKQQYNYIKHAEEKSIILKTTVKKIIKTGDKDILEDNSILKDNYNKQIELTQHKKQTIKEEHDKSIIDVNTEILNLTIERSMSKSEGLIEPPYWEHSYIYTYGEINLATKAQKEYYYYFKNKVLNNEFVDICGYTNYAFILYFDFLNEYGNHRDIILLKKQFRLVGQICPATKSYSLRSLQNELRKRSDFDEILMRLNDIGESNSHLDYDYSHYNPDKYKLGHRYKKKLELDKQEVRWLNKFYNPINVFTSIEKCCIATIKQYIFIVKELNKQLIKKGTTLAKEVAFFKEELNRFYTNRYNSELGYYDASYISSAAESDVYLTIFKRVENSVRESFGHKRKISGDFPYADKSLSEEFEIKFGNLLNELIIAFIDDIEEPNIETQIELNTQNVNRWRIEFNTLKGSFEIEDKTKFINGILLIEETNQKNPNIENIFFETSKFIAKYDKIQSLKYYAKYIYYNLKSNKFKNKKLTKTVRESLFKTDEQLSDYNNILAELIRTSDIQKALNDIAYIYLPERKKIKLDKSVIKDVELKHEGTVRLLSEYLETDKKETDYSDTKNEEIVKSFIPTNITNSIFISQIIIGKIQEELITKIVANSFEIHQNEVDEFATKNGLFKNQLIDSINEACAEYLQGEVLIEEDNENYVIEESYYKEIVQ